MCGICGFVERKDAAEGRLRTMLDLLVHRGPDEDGVYCQGPVALGIRRLSIIDRKGGQQPIPNEDKSVWAVMNGEIYNFVELRESLQEQGHRFSTKSDTEVIVHLYEDVGESFVEHLRGMFAIAVWDERREELILARDRLGIKPLFYAERNGGLQFASEMKSLLAITDCREDLDYAALDAYFTYKYIPEPLTAFRGIKKLPAGQTLRYCRGRVTLRQYWDVRHGAQGVEQATEDEYMELIDQKLEESVRIHLMSEVPLGALLSGGIDSSTLVAYMSRATEGPVKTFTIGFNEKRWDERASAETVAKYFGTEHHVEVVEQDAIEELLPKLVWHLDEPFADSSILPTYYVSKMAKEHVTVALSGEGGDELFAGYSMYQGLRFAQMYRKLPAWAKNGVLPALTSAAARLAPGPFRYEANRVNRIIGESGLPLGDLFYGKNVTFTDDQRRRLYSGELQNLVQSDTRAHIDACLERTQAVDDVDQLGYLDLRFRLLNDILVKVDRMSMSQSLEVRVPFLDHELVELVCAIPPHLKLKGFQRKYLLKRIAASMLPSPVLKKKKWGFLPPISQWFKGDLANYCEHLLLDGTSATKTLFNQTEIKAMLETHRRGAQDLGQHLWHLLVFEVWYRTHVSGSSTD